MIRFHTFLLFLHVLTQCYTALSQGKTTHLGGLFLLSRLDKAQVGLLACRGREDLSTRLCSLEMTGTEVRGKDETVLVRCAGTIPRAQYPVDYHRVGNALMPAARRGR